ncbi:MAG TPA: DNA-binding transcriptional regulator [Opitutaceae bacterium]|jgi:LacI family transcriptional regulator|nr:DNA-binding transcriptional regulator [Opitutaceae bacterium]
MIARARPKAPPGRGRAGAAAAAPQARPPDRPDVLLIFKTRFEESTAMLKGIAHFERNHEFWTAFHDDQGRAEEDPRWLRSKSWQGVISRHTTPGLAAACAELKIPLVDLNDVELFPGVPKIRPDNVGIGHLGAEHFIERGYRHLAFSGFGCDLWSRERRDGFVEAATLAGRICTVYDVDYPGDLTPFWDAEQMDCLALWLQGLRKPVGVMACNDMRAQQVVAAAHARNILVPEEVAVLGANNDAIRCELAYPALSSVAPNAFQSGYRAAALLFEMLAGRRPKRLDERVEPLGVVTRRSTDVLALEDRIVARALSFIREHACRGLSVDTVLREAHTSRSQLERKFRHHIGRSPQAEIRRVQLEKIRQLLLETDFPLKRIAELSGFEHMEYMCVMFKRITGDSPGSYRSRMQAKLPAGGREFGQ